MLQFIEMEGLSVEAQMEHVEEFKAALAKTFNEAEKRYNQDMTYYPNVATITLGVRNSYMIYWGSTKVKEAFNDFIKELSRDLAIEYWLNKCGYQLPKEVVDVVKSSINHTILSEEFGKEFKDKLDLVQQILGVVK